MSRPRCARRARAIAQTYSGAANQATEAWGCGSVLTPEASQQDPLATTETMSVWAVAWQQWQRLPFVFRFAGMTTWRQPMATLLAPSVLRYLSRARVPAGRRGNGRGVRVRWRPFGQGARAGAGT